MNLFGKWFNMLPERQLMVDFTIQPPITVTAPLEYNYNIDLLENIQRLEAEIKRLKAGENWVSVRDRLPPVGDIVEVWTSEGQKRHSKYVSRERKWKEFYFPTMVPTYTVTHWKYVVSPNGVIIK